VLIASYSCRNPNVIGVGSPFLGPMSRTESQTVDIRGIRLLLTHEKFISPNLYKNIGLIQINSTVRTSAKILPVCFPFLAGVLDILQFIGMKGKTAGFNFPGILDFAINAERKINSIAI
jgi:hypothetical protein